MQIKHFISTMVLFAGIVFQAFSQNYLINEGFSGGTTPPAGFTFTGLGTYTSSAGSGQAIPSLKFDDSGDQLITPVFNNADEVRFWLKGYSVDAASALSVAYLQANNWVNLATINNLASTGTSYTFPLPATATQLRFTYTKSAGNIAFDDLSVRASAVVAKPEMQLSFNNQLIKNTETIQAGNAATGTNFQLPITLENSGTADLNITSVNVSGDVTVAAMPPNIISPLNSSTLLLNINTNSIGSKTGTVIISSNSATFQFQVAASVTAPAVAMPAGITPQNGDFRTSAATAISNNQSTALEQYQNGNWQIFTAAVPASATVYALHALTFSGNNQLSKLIVAGNATANLSQNSSLLTTQDLKVFSGSSLIIEGELTNTGILEVQDRATLKINYAFANPAAQLFAGTEIFHPNSEIIVEKWSTVQALSGSFISPNSSGYLFGNLTINTNLSSNWQMFPAGVTAVTAGDFTVQQTGSNSIILTGEGVSELFFGKSFKILSGNVRLQDAATAATKVVIRENLQLDGGNFILSNQISAGANFNLNLEGDLLIAAAAQLNNNNTGSLSSSAVNFSGNKIQKLSAVPAVNTVPFIIKSGSELQLQQSFLLNTATIANAGSLTIENGATLDFGKSTNVISGNGLFTLAQGGKLNITSTEGIMAAGTSGHVQVRDNRRTFHSQAIYQYSGTQAQQTGTGLPTTTSGKILIIDNPVSVTLTQNTGISNNTNISPDGGRLEIRQGTFITPAGADVLSSGKLIMTGGTYRIHSLNATFPQLTGSYSLSGGTIELAGNGNQILRGNTYFQIVISGDNSDGLTSKGISTSTTITQKLEIKPNAVFDITNKTMAGDGGLVMTGGVFRTAKLTGTLPELSGNNHPYELSGGTVELYGTGATQSQSIRGNFGNGQKIIYNNLQIGAAEANLTTPVANAVVGSSLEIAGTMRVVAPASVQIASNRSVNGTGNFILEKGATLFYGAAEGIKKSGSGITDGNIRVSGNRIFSEEASFGLIGALDMVTGDALPARIQNLIVDKSAGTVTLSNALEVGGNLTLQNGIIKTNLAELFLSADDPAALVKFSETAYIDGKMRRTMLQNGTYHFPVGTEAQLHLLTFTTENLSGTDYKNVAVNFSKTETGTTISVQENEMYLNAIAEPGVWQVQPNAAPSAGAYTVSASLKGFNNLTDNKFALVLKPVVTDPKAIVPLADSWTSGDGTLAEAGTAGRTVSGGYAYKSGMTTFGTLGIGTEITPLPVTWGHFSAVFAENSVKTNWSTLCEIDNSHFEVERSADGVLFSKIGKVEPKAAGTGVNQYQFVDENPLAGISYYRIRQVDFSGEASYTKVVAVNSSATAISMSSVFPNPAVSETNISVNLPAPKQLEVTVYDLQSRLLKNYSYNLGAGSHVLPLDLNNFVPGTYLIRISTVSKQESHRLVVQ